MFLRLHLNACWRIWSADAWNLPWGFVCFLVCFSWMKMFLFLQNSSGLSKKTVISPYQKTQVHCGQPCSVSIPSGFVSLLHYLDFNETCPCASAHFELAILHPVRLIDLFISWLPKYGTNFFHNHLYHLQIVFCFISIYSCKHWCTRVWMLQTLPSFYLRKLGWIPLLFL